MSKKNMPDGVDRLFTECRASHCESRQFSKLLDAFKEGIKNRASKYPKFWFKDFKQEGAIGLWKAVQKYPAALETAEFKHYALTVIENQMIDFYRLVIGKAMVDVTGPPDYDGNSTTSKEPIFSQSKAYVDREGVLEDYQNNYPSPVDHVTSSTLAIDFKYILNREHMKQNHFSEKEINVFDLFFNKGYNVSEVASKIRMSVPQTSRIINKTKSKVQQILAYTSNNNPN
jgi:RNA polymerase sigma factor (sigma-70 family)